MAGSRHYGKNDLIGRSVLKQSPRAVLGSEPSPLAGIEGAVRFLCSDSAYSARGKPVRKSDEQISFDRSLVELLSADGLRVLSFPRVQTRTHLFRNGKWKIIETNPDGLGGQHGGQTIRVAEGNSWQDTARALVHETQHHRQAKGLSTSQSETDAYVVEEWWAIERKLPPASYSQRTKDGRQPDEKSIAELQEKLSASKLTRDGSGPTESSTERIPYKITPDGKVIDLIIKTAIGRTVQRESNPRDPNEGELITEAWNGKAWEPLTTYKSPELKDVPKSTFRCAPNP
jgi:hypothetical protein